MQEISQQDNPEKFTQLPISWEEKGIRKGIEQGLKTVPVHQTIMKV